MALKPEKILDRKKSVLRIDSKKTCCLDIRYNNYISIVDNHITKYNQIIYVIHQSHIIDVKINVAKSCCDDLNPFS